MLELGARPHPPRDLYRAYIAQSDVFIGIYGDSYGWVAPDEEVSGLEDEYNLAPASMPKLIYIKTSQNRDDRLRELIGRIRSDDTAAYLPFETAADLEEQVAGDLATLLAERFDESRRQATAAASADRPESHMPVPFTRIIGREKAIEDIVALLSDHGTRLVTLCGPGGIGKSRLSIAVAEAAAPLFPDGTVFVPLENVLEPELLLSTIGYALGIRETTGLQLEERLALALDKRRVLFVLDNFEQLVSAAPILVQLFTIAPDAKFLVTSRVVLRMRGEQRVRRRAARDPRSRVARLARAGPERACRRTVRGARVRRQSGVRTDRGEPGRSGRDLPRARRGPPRSGTRCGAHAAAHARRHPASTRPAARPARRLVARPS